jgi:hypothetical protein
MSDDFQISALTSGQMSLLAQSESGPFNQGTPLRSFWCGQLAQRWDLKGPVSKIDFLTMATCKRPANLLTQEAIDQYQRVENNHLLSGGWGIEIAQPENFSKFVQLDPRLVDVVEDSLRETFSRVLEAQIYAVIPKKKSEKTGLGAFCGFIYADKSLCFLFDVTLIPYANASCPIDEKLLS